MIICKQASEAPAKLREHGWLWRVRFAESDKHAEAMMDEFQATPAGEIKRLRADSAIRFGDFVLTCVVGELVNVGGMEAVARARDAIAKGIQEHPDHEEADDRAARLAVEEFERAI